MNPTHLNDPKGEAGSKKTPLHLLPPYALAQTALAHAEGARRYGPWNWRRTGVCATTYIGAILRHLTAWQDGEDIDADSGLSHIAKIGACCNILLDAGHCGTLVDDRSKVPRMTPAEITQSLRDEDFMGQQLTSCPWISLIPSGLMGNPQKFDDPHGVFVEPETPFTELPEQMPKELPPLPPVPEGFSRWEYRGTGWDVGHELKYFGYCLNGKTWSTSAGCPSGGSGHYIEAVK